MAPPCGRLEKKTHTASPDDQIRSRLGARGCTGRLSLMREVHATNQTAGHREVLQERKLRERPDGMIDGEDFAV